MNIDYQENIHKKVAYSNTARNKIVKGIEKLNKAVSATLGPNGRNVLYTINGGRTVFSTKDGVTVTRVMRLPDTFEEVGSNLLKQAAEKANDKAGDGTTTATVLTSEIVKNGLESLSNGANAVKIKRDIEEAVKTVVSKIREDVKEDITSEEQLLQIATISANNDEETGKLISTALQKVGRDGVVSLEKSKTGETYLEVVEGLQFKRGYKSPHFVNNKEDMTCVLEDPFILIMDERLDQVKDMLPLLERISSEGKPLLIIANEIEGEALAAMIVNKMRGILNSCAVVSPHFGETRSLHLEDIAILTGGEVFSKKKAMKLDRFSWDWIGSARKVVVSKFETTIIGGKGKTEDIDSRISQLQSNIEKETRPLVIEKLQERLGSLVGGVAVINVGGDTEVEYAEKKDRYEDSLNATKAAIEEGIVPGGGIALIHARESINRDSIGGEIVYKACGKPFKQILENAGFSEIEAELLSQHEIKNSKNIWIGIDVDTGKSIDMKELGIIDPAKVTRSALECAASVAGTVLLTETVIVEDPTDDRKDKQVENILDDN